MGRPLALVTGASSGIGTAFAERLASSGHDLLLVARRWPRLEELAVRLRESERVEVTVRPADLEREEDVDALAATIREGPPLDLLVNNAGFGTAGPFASLPIDRELGMVRLNVIALVRLTHAALPGMRARGCGGIIQVSSLAAFQPNPYFATYGATKAFVTSFAEALAEELRGSGVRLVVLCPGFTRTEFQQVAGVNAVRVPFAWMSPQAVVDEALEALRRQRVVCVPGLSNRVLAILPKLAPRFLVRRVIGVLGRWVVSS